MRVINFSFMCESRWPLPFKKRLVLVLQKSHLFSNSDLYYSAKDLSAFMPFQPSKKKMERGNAKVHRP